MTNKAINLKLFCNPNTPVYVPVRKQTRRNDIGTEMKNLIKVATSTLTGKTKERKANPAPTPGGPIEVPAYPVALGVLMGLYYRDSYWFEPSAIIAEALEILDNSPEVTKREFMCSFGNDLVSGQGWSRSDAFTYASTLYDDIRGDGLDYLLKWTEWDWKREERIAKRSLAKANREINRMPAKWYELDNQTMEILEDEVKGFTDEDGDVVEGGTQYLHMSLKNKLVNETTGQTPREEYDDRGVTGACFQYIKFVEHELDMEELSEDELSEMLGEMDDDERVGYEKTEDWRLNQMKYSDSVNYTFGEGMTDTMESVLATGLDWTNIVVDEDSEKENIRRYEQALKLEKKADNAGQFDQFGSYGVPEYDWTPQMEFNKLQKKCSKQKEEAIKQALETIKVIKCPVEMTSFLQTEFDGYARQQQWCKHVKEVLFSRHVPAETLQDRKNLEAKLRKTKDADWQPLWDFEEVECNPHLPMQGFEFYLQQFYTKDGWVEVVMSAGRQLGLGDKHLDKMMALLDSALSQSKREGKQAKAQEKKVKRNKRLARYSKTKATVTKQKDTFGEVLSILTQGHEEHLEWERSSI